ncbi:hypothetical protein NIES4074_55410 [Cylindrospermum sp. NIES-4074]|nr:hypothetical protein NIES4074_55410 [Cylindrospermum sp. NIES-4074]
MGKSSKPLKKVALTIVIGELLIVFPLLVFNVGKSVNLTCKRIEPNYVNCQQQLVHFYGLWSNQSKSFKLTSVEVQEYVFKEDLPEGTFIYLTTSNSGEKLYFYGTNLSAALADKERLDNLLLGTGEQALNLTLKNSKVNAFGILEMLLGIHGLFIFSVIFIGLFWLMFYLIFFAIFKNGKQV